MASTWRSSNSFGTRVVRGNGTCGSRYYEMGQRGYPGSPTPATRQMPETNWGSKRWQGSRVANRGLPEKFARRLWRQRTTENPKHREGDLRVQKRNRRLNIEIRRLSAAYSPVAGANQETGTQGPCFACSRIRTCSKRRSARNSLRTAECVRGNRGGGGGGGGGGGVGFGFARRAGMGLCVDSKWKTRSRSLRGRAAGRTGSFAHATWQLWMRLRVTEKAEGTHTEIKPRPTGPELDAVGPARKQAATFENSCAKRH